MELAQCCFSDFLFKINMLECPEDELLLDDENVSNNSVVASLQFMDDSVACKEPPSKSFIIIDLKW